MRWRGRHPRGHRRPATSSDPVGAVLSSAAADGPLVRRLPDVQPTLAELPGWVDVDDADDVDGFDTVVRFADEVGCCCDAYDDGLDLALADQPGLEEVFAEDREVLYLRTSLALVDVKAAVLRAIIDVNRNPRQPAPTAVLSDDVLDELASAMRPLLERSGFATTLGQVRYFYREGGDGFVQSIAVAPGTGRSRDGTDLDGTVWVMSGTHVPGLARSAPATADRVAPVHCRELAQHWTAPEPDALRRALEGDVLPVLDGTRDRAGFAGWVGADPTRVSVPADRPAHARRFAEWGLVEPAARVVAHVDRHWRSLRTHPDTVAARDLIRSAQGS